jgi:uncharacterized tellurite resistance protein B-like protein
MLEQIRGLFKRIVSAADEQKQREAMVDLLIWTMYADNVLTLPENEKIDQVTDEMEWKSATSAQQYIYASIAKVREALDDPEKAELLLDDISERLNSDDMRMRTYEACRDLASVDGEVADKEMHFLNAVKKHFQID